MFNVTKPKAKEEKKEVEEEQKEVYGEETISGSSPTDVDIDEALEQTLGNQPKRGVPFSLEEEVKKDEKARR